MAYVAFSDFGGAAAGRAVRQVLSPDPVPLTAAGEGRLSALEWSVVAIARRDGRASLRRPSRMATALRVLFRHRNPRLADERLEALRRMAVLTWRAGYAVPSRELAAFFAAGFTPGQYETMARSIGAAQANARRDSGRAAARASA